MECLLTGTSRHNPAPLIDGGLWRYYQPGEYAVVLCHGCLRQFQDDPDTLGGRYEPARPPAWEV